MEVKKWWDTKKAMSEKAKKAEEQVVKADETRKKVGGELASIRSEHSCYLHEVLPIALDQARQQAVADYQNRSSLKPISSLNIRRE